MAALRVDARHHVLDCAVFPGGIHGLKDEQHRPAVLRIEFFLQAVEQTFACIEYLLRVLLASDAGRVNGVPILQTKLFTLGYTKRCSEARGLFDELVAIHGFGSVVQTCRSEQRAQSPAESGETISGEKDGFVRETDGAVEAKQIESVVSAKRNIDTGHGPAEFDPRGAVKHAVG